MRDGLAAATGAPLDGTKDAMLAAADKGFDIPEPLKLELFISVLVPVRYPSKARRKAKTQDHAREDSPWMDSRRTGGALLRGIAQ